MTKKTTKTQKTTKIVLFLSIFMLLKTFFGVFWVKKRKIF